MLISSIFNIYSVCQYYLISLFFGYQINNTKIEFRNSAVSRMSDKIINFSLFYIN